MTTRRALQQLSQVFALEGFLKQEIGADVIRRYYESCLWVYHWLHCPDGALHLALSRDGKRFSRRDFTGQPRLVEDALVALRARRVAELGCGKGFNTLFLARRHPGVHFDAVDLTPGHVKEAQRVTRRLRNVHCAVGDYHHTELLEKSYELVFAIECLCHARDLTAVLSEAFRLLAPGGRLVVTDGFREADFDQCPVDVQLACQLVELSMVVERFWQVDVFVRTAQAVGFTVVEQRDLGTAILPNLKWLQHVATLFFAFPPLARLLVRLLPPYLVRHAITGLLGALTLEQGAQGYWLLVLQKPHENR